MNEIGIAKDVSLEKIVTSSIQLPGVKVNRSSFLTGVFEKDGYDLDAILESGPLAAGISREKLAAIANKIVLKRTGESSVASFVAGIPGGFAMAATIPLDVLQFFGMALRLAQEMSYLYGAGDLWTDGQIDDDKVKNQLLLYCGVMFGVSGAVSGVRVLTAQVAKTAAKKIPQKALTKTFWYPIIKQIGKALSIKVTKTTVANGVSKAVPVIGGVISGGLNFASMYPMAMRLQKTLDKASFSYSDEEFEKDIIEIENISNAEPTEEKDVKTKIIDGGKKAIGGITGLLSKKKTVHGESALDTLKKLSELKDAGVITEEEFNEKKADLLAKI